MTTDEFPGVRWHGHWVAPDVPDFVIDPTSVGADLPPAGFSRAQFRRVFERREVPARVPLRLSADSRYVLWVNGVEVGRGPIRSQPRRLRYDEYDIADHLRPGANVRRGAGHLLRARELVLAAGGLQRGDGPRRAAGARGPARRGLAGQRRAVAGTAVAAHGAGWPPARRWRESRSSCSMPASSTRPGSTPTSTTRPGWPPRSQGHPRRSPGRVPAAGRPVRGDASPRHRHPRRRPGGAADADASRPPQQSPDLPDHPADRLVQQLRDAGDKQAVQLPLTVAQQPGLGDPADRRLRPDRGRPRRARGRRPERGPAGPVLPGVRALRRRRRPGRLRAPQQRQLHHPRLRRPLQGGRHQRAAADLPDDPAGNRRGHDPRPRGQRVPLPVHRRRRRSPPATPS